MEEYDVVCIGTSPAVVLEMATLQSQGLRTLMIDSASDFGGAWGTYSSPILGEVDTGPHLVSPLPGLPNFFKDVLGFVLEPTIPKPKYIMPRKIFGSNQTDLKNRWGGSVKKTNHSSLDASFLRAFLSPYYQIAKSALKPNLKQKDDLGYVQINGGDFKHYLKGLSKKWGLETRFGEFVEEITIDSKNHTVKVFTDLREIKTKKFMLTSCAVLNKISVDNDTYAIPSKSDSLHHVHFVLKGSKVNKFSIGVISHSTNIRLVGNLTPFIDQKYVEKGFSLVSALLTDSISHTEPNKALIFEEIKSYGILNKDNIILDSYWVPHNTPQRQDDDLYKIQKQFQPYILTLPTHSFHRIMEQRLELWHQALGSS